LPIGDGVFMQQSNYNNKFKYFNITFRARSWESEANFVGRNGSKYLKADRMWMAANAIEFYYSTAVGHVNMRIQCIVISRLLTKEITLF
jgi:hypothetical protein